MNIYDKYLEEIKQRKTQGLHPKPIDNSELLDQIKLFLLRTKTKSKYDISNI